MMIIYSVQDLGPNAGRTMTRKIRLYLKKSGGERALGAPSFSPLRPHRDVIQIFGGALQA